MTLLGAATTGHGVIGAFESIARFVLLSFRLGGAYCLLTVFARKSGFPQARGRWSW